MPKIHTGERTYGDWKVSRGQAIADYWDFKGLSWELVWLLIPMFLAHMTLETGGGVHEWNYNLANEKAHGSLDPLSEPGWHGAAMTLTNAREGAELYRAYDTLEDGTWGYFEKLLDSARYSDDTGWAIHQVAQGANPREVAAQWYRGIEQSGWSPYSEADVSSYLSVYDRIERFNNDG